MTGWEALNFSCVLSVLGSLFGLRLCLSLLAPATGVIAVLLSLRCHRHVASRTPLPSWLTQVDLVHRMASPVWEIGGGWA